MSDPGWKGREVEAFDPELWSIVWMSLRVSGTTLVISSLIGVLLGAWLGLAQFRGKPLAEKACRTAPASVSPIR